MSTQEQRQAEVPGGVLTPNDPRVQRVVALMNELGIDFRGEPIPMPWGTIIPRVVPVVTRIMTPVGLAGPPTDSPKTEVVEAEPM